MHLVSGGAVCMFELTRGNSNRDALWRLWWTFGHHNTREIFFLISDYVSPVYVAHTVFFIKYFAGRWSFSAGPFPQANRWTHMGHRQTFLVRWYYSSGSRLLVNAMQITALVSQTWILIISYTNENISYWLSKKFLNKILCLIKGVY
jgi:hypothetical protein